MSDWSLIFVEPAKTILNNIGQFMKYVLVVLVILVIGWVLSRVLRLAITRLLKSLRLDELADKIEVDNMLTRGGIHYSLSELIGIICYWLGLLVTFVVAVNAIGLTIAADLLNRVVLYVPNIIAAIFILILGMFLATLLKNIVQTAAVNAGLSQPTFFSRVVEVVVVVFAVLMALEQLNIGARIIELMVTIFLGSIGLAFALAFGFGCQEPARKMLTDFIEKFQTKK